MLHNSLTNELNNDYKMNKADRLISIVLAILIVLQPVLSAINVFTNIYFANTPLDTLFVYLILSVFIIKALPAIIKRSYLLIIISLFVLFVLCLFSTTLYPENQRYIDEYFKDSFITVFPYLFLGFAMNDYESLSKYLMRIVPFAILSGSLIFIIMLSTLQTISSDYMAFAYSILPSVILTFYFALTTGKMKYIIFSVIGAALLIAAGTRGTLICLVVYICLYFLTHMKSKKIISTIIVSSVAFIWFTASEGMLDFLNWLNDVFGKIGVSTRILEFFFTNDFFNKEGRDLLADTINNAINEHPLMGYGIFGDRPMLQRFSPMPTLSMYTHNIILEFMCAFGIIIGSICLIYLAYLIIRTYFVDNSFAKKEFILIFLPMAIIKLFMSSSFLLEPYFFLLLGMCFQTIFRSKRNINYKAI